MKINPKLGTFNWSFSLGLILGTFGILGLEFDDFFLTSVGFSGLFFLGF